MNRSKMFWMIALVAVFAVHPFSGLFAEEGSDTPALVVTIFDGNGSLPLTDVKVAVQGDEPGSLFGREKQTDQDGVVRFTKEDFKDFAIHKGFSDELELDRYDGQSSLDEGYLMVKLVVTTDGDFSEEHEIQIRLNEEMSYRANISGDM